MQYVLVAMSPILNTRCHIFILKIGLGVVYMTIEQLNHFHMNLQSSMSHCCNIRRNFKPQERHEFSGEVGAISLKNHCF